MPRQEVIDVYKFEELSDRAKEKAREWYRKDWEYTWADENIRSLNAWADWFCVKIKDYSLGGSDNQSQGVKFEINIDDNIAELRGVRLWKYFQNQLVMPDLSGNGPFTGFCFDEILLDPIRDFMKRPWNTDYEELMQDCINKFTKAYADDFDCHYSDEAVDESIIANEYEFNVDGSVF